MQTEWCYNYHDEEKPEACHPHWYPTIEEQERFVRAYLKHQRSGSGSGSISGPVGNSTSASAFQPAYTSSPRIPPFTLDNHTPPSISLSGSSIADNESRDRDRDHDRTSDAETAQLLRETRLWRIANSAQWVAWGIVQANVPGLEEAMAKLNNNDTRTTTPATTGDGDTNTTTNGGDSSPETPPPEQKENGTAETSTSTGTGTGPSSAQVIEEVAAEEVAEDFDYLAYAQERALFFWADIWELGLVKEEEFPVEMVEHVKKRVISR